MLRISLYETFSSLVCERASDEVCQGCCDCSTPSQPETCPADAPLAALLSFQASSPFSPIIHFLHISTPMRKKSQTTQIRQKKNSQNNLGRRGPGTKKHQFPSPNASSTPSPGISFENSPNIASRLCSRCFPCFSCCHKPKKQKTPQIHNLHAHESVYLLRLVKDVKHQFRMMPWLQWSWLILNLLFAFVVTGLLVAHVVVYALSEEFQHYVDYQKQHAHGSGSPTSVSVFFSSDQFFYMLIIIAAIICEQIFAFIVIWYERGVALLVGYFPSLFFVLFRIGLALVDKPGPYLIAMGSAQLFGCLIFLLHALFLPRTFGWKTFNTVGGIEKNMFYFRHWEIISAIWIADLQYTAIIVALALNCIEYSWWFLILLLISAVGSLILVALHKWIVQREMRIVLIVCFVWNLILPIYFIYKCAMIMAGPHRNEVEAGLPRDSHFDKNLLMRLIHLCSTIAVFVFSRVVLNLAIVYHLLFMNGNLRQIFDEKYRERREKRLETQREREELNKQDANPNDFAYAVKEAWKYVVDNVMLCLGRVRYGSFGLVYVEAKHSSRSTSGNTTEDETEMEDQKSAPHSQQSTLLKERI